MCITGLWRDRTQQSLCVISSTWSSPAGRPYCILEAGGGPRALRQRGGGGCSPTAATEHAPSLEDWDGRLLRTSQHLPNESTKNKKAAYEKTRRKENEFATSNRHNIHKYKGAANQRFYIEQSLCQICPSNSCQNGHQKSTSWEWFLITQKQQQATPPPPPKGPLTPRCKRCWSIIADTSFTWAANKPKIKPTTNLPFLQSDWSGLILMTCFGGCIEDRYS